MMKEKFARWNILFVQYLKRDWKKVIIWILGLGLFASAFIPAFEEIAKGEGLIGMYETLQNPAMISIVGPTPIETASDYTLGAMYAHEMLLFCSLFAMTISMLHVIGHTRKEEDLGLTELVRSFQIGRQANSLAVIAETIFINILLVLFISGVMMSFGADTISGKGSFLFGASIGVAGIIGAVIALVMAQIMPVSSAATGSSLGIMGLLYIIRAAVRHLLIGPAIDEDAVDPALEQRREGPPEDRVDQHQRIGARDPRLLRCDRGIDTRLFQMHRDVIGGEARVEAFSGEIGDFEAVAALREPGTDLPRDSSRQRFRQRMGNDDKAVHGWRPARLRAAHRRYILLVSYLWYFECQASPLQLPTRV